MILTCNKNHLYDRAMCWCNCHSYPIDFQTSTNNQRKLNEKSPMVGIEYQSGCWCEHINQLTKLIKVISSHLTLQQQNFLAFDKLMQQSKLMNLIGFYLLKTSKCTKQSREANLIILIFFVILTTENIFSFVLKI